MHRIRPYGHIWQKTTVWGDLSGVEYFAVFYSLYINSRSTTQWPVCYVHLCLRGVAETHSKTPQEGLREALIDQRKCVHVYDR